MTTNEGHVVDTLRSSRNGKIVTKSCFLFVKSVLRKSTLFLASDIQPLTILFKIH